MTWIRVKDAVTKHEYSRWLDDGATLPEGLEQLDKDGADRFGNSLPAKPHITVQTVADLRSYAQEHQIDLGDASRKDDIAAKIAAHEQGNPAD